MPSNEPIPADDETNQARTFPRDTVEGNIARRLSWALFAIGGTSLVAWALWETAARSLVPLALDEVVISKETRLEKHPGHDDVYLLKFARGRIRHVDGENYRQVAEGERIRKAAGSWELIHGNASVPLALSSDFRGHLSLAIAWVFSIAWWRLIAALQRR